MSSKGFSLIEVMVSMVITSLVLAGMLPVFLSHIQYNTQSELRTAAMMAAQFRLDELRVLDPVNLPTSGSDDPQIVAVGDRGFQVTTTYCADADYCASPNNRHLTVDVAYGGQTIYAVQTVFTQLR